MVHKRYRKLVEWFKSKIFGKSWTFLLAKSSRQNVEFFAMFFLRYRKPGNGSQSYRKLVEWFKCCSKVKFWKSFDFLACEKLAPKC